MNRIIRIGIDPGKSSGGLGIIRIDGHPSAEAYACPQTMQDMLRLLKIIRSILEIDVKAVIEKVHGFSGQCAGASFSFGANYGAWLMALTALHIPYKEVAPGTWLKRYGKMPKGKTPRKNRLKELAQQRFPQLKITHATAAALLIAEYAKEVAWK